MTRGGPGYGMKPGHKSRPKCEGSYRYRAPGKQSQQSQLRAHDAINVGSVSHQVTYALQKESGRELSGQVSGVIAATAAATTTAMMAAAAAGTSKQASSSSKQARRQAASAASISGGGGGFMQASKRAGERDSRKAWCGRSGLDNQTTP